MADRLSITGAALLALAVFFASAATAGVVKSPHDIDSQLYGILKKEDKKKQMVCNFCHVPYKKKSARIWDKLPKSLEYWGRSGSICYSCHDGVVFVNPNVDASMTAYHPESHGLAIEDLPENDDTSDAGLPYTGGSVDENIQCTSCHNPHENEKRPFLRSKLNELCQKCHQRRENSGYERENTEGTHPVHKKPADEVMNPSPIDVVDDFKVPFPGEYPPEEGKFRQGVHWTLGGHLSEGNDGTIECITCHSVHGKERIGPVTDHRLLSLDPVMEVSNEFCEGCHRGKRGDEVGEPPYPNPGGTEIGRTYHPADDDIANGEGRIVAINEPEGWIFGEGGEVLCNTCHKAHDAIPNSPILRPTVESDTFCEECHSDQAFLERHHPIGEIGASSGIDSGKPHADTREPVIPPNVLGSGITYGEPKEGSLYCSSCHRAHNAPCIPILVIKCDPVDSSCSVCYECHPKFNPTWQTDEAWKASHFIGDPTLSVIDKVDSTTGETVGTQPGYFDQFPPTNKDPWPDSGLTSKYDGESGFGINCCSCHSFSSGGVVGGDADQDPYSEEPLLAPGYVEGDMTSGLLARAGMWKEWEFEDVDDVEIGGERGTVQKVYTYLCTGCHGLTPNTLPGVGVEGEGFTHELIEADGTKFPLDPNTSEINYTFNDHINCESCHKPHEADSRGGFYILREVELLGSFKVISTLGPNVNTTDPYIIRQRDELEFAPLCHKCHIGY